MGSWPFWVSGSLIGLLVVLFAWIAGKGFGVSTGFGTFLGRTLGQSAFRRKPYTGNWRLWFLAGFPIGGLLSAGLAGELHWKSRIGLFESVFGESAAVRAAVLLAGGFLVGYGARLAGG